MSDFLPTRDDLLQRMHVVRLPLAFRFRGVTHREIALIDGPSGWGEFSPFLEYGTAEASAWLHAAILDAWTPRPEPLREAVPVNATLPAIEASRVAEVLSRFPGCRTVKMKVAERGQSLADDVARATAAREFLGDSGRLRIDANGGWNVDEAETAIRALEPFDLEYVEQPCASVEELAEVRQRISKLTIPVAADESVRKASDPLAVARAGAADILVVKAQPLGGLQRALEITRQAGLPVVVSSALDSSIGLSLGAALAAALPELPFDCGLGTRSLFEYDIATPGVQAVDGAVSPARVVPDAARLEEFAVTADRRDWWMQRASDALALLSRERSARA
ncbi:o-succinylbenzoate synthase [Humidisolicoccus flavus]|uniref:o-succinylbenzoate synthase n=1 Tax=Humidisolicoccus flavus TaxID=3111414 RepID=UPI0032504587